MMRRKGDRTKLVRSVFGAFLVVSAVLLKFRLPHTADWLVIALVIVGAGMVSPTFIVDAIKAWRAQ